MKFVKKFGVPTLVLGGGGYNIERVARCWAYETSVLLGLDISNEIPYNDYWEYFAPDYNLQIEPSNLVNKNTPEYLIKLKEKVLQNLGQLKSAPSVQMQEVPSTYYPSDDDDNVDPDSRPVADKADAPGEFYDGDRDQVMEVTENGVLS